MSKEAREQEIAEMRRQIAELKAEAERADGEDKQAGSVLSDTFSLCCFAVTDFAVDEYWLITRMHWSVYWRTISPLTYAN